MTEAAAQQDGTNGDQQTRRSRRVRSENRQRTTLVALRLLPEEHGVLVRAAQARGVSLSELLRVSAMEAIASQHF